MPMTTRQGPRVTASSLEGIVEQGCHVTTMRSEHYETTVESLAVSSERLGGSAASSEGFTETSARSTGSPGSDAETGLSLEKIDSRHATSCCCLLGRRRGILRHRHKRLLRSNGKLTVNQYVVIRDPGQGSSAEVRLCGRMRHDGESKAGDNLEGVGAAREGESGQEERATEAEMAQSFVEGDDDSGLYAMKIYDRAKMMKRGAWFARGRERRPDGVSLEDAQPPEKFVKVQEEITIMKRLLHPNIVQLIAVMDDPLASSPFIVMSYVERGSIMNCVEPERGRYASQIPGSCFDASTAARYFADILTGLEFLHLQLIAHRDLKPENVLLGNNDRARIADFGASQYFADDA